MLRLDVRRRRRLDEGRRVPSRRSGRGQRRGPEPLDDGRAKLGRHEDARRLARAELELGPARLQQLGDGNGERPRALVEGDVGDDHGALDDLRGRSIDYLNGHISGRRIAGGQRHDDGGKEIARKRFTRSPRAARAYVGDPDRAELDAEQLEKARRVERPCCARGRVQVDGRRWRA